MGCFRAWQWTYMTSMKSVLTLKLKNSRFSYSEISTLHPPPQQLTQRRHRGFHSSFVYSTQRRIPQVAEFVVLVP